MDKHWRNVSMSIRHIFLVVSHGFARDSKVDTDFLRRKQFQIRLNFFKNFSGLTCSLPMNPEYYLLYFHIFGGLSKDV